MSEPAPARAHALSLIEILQSVPADGALFTSFTLSLTWFETHLLRGLERRGIRQVLVLADPRGVAESASESLAMGPGLRYALEAVEAPAGVFHPKLALLWSREHLLLAVGSGNLTFAGMQHNLEAWEVLAAGVPGLSLERQLTRSLASDLLSFL